MTVGLKTKFLALIVGIGSTAMIAGAQSAHAERILSDYEASKLTLASLTATPPPPVIHHYTYHASKASHVAVASRQHAPLHGMVHLASYHVVAKTASAAHHTRHHT